MHTIVLYHTRARDSVKYVRLVNTLAGCIFCFYNAKIILMDFLKKLLHRDYNFSESVVLIDIGSKSVVGAYVFYKKGELPQLIYTLRLPIKPHKNENQEYALIRSLKDLCDDLIKKGAPALVRTTGNGTANRILVSFDAPWQETVVRTEIFEKESSFIFTRDLVAKRLEKTITVPKGKILVDESIVGTILNGYVTHNPYGNKVRRASVTVLTSLVRKLTTKSIVSVIKNAYHSENIFSISGNSLRYQAIRSIFPHEHDALILDDTSKSVTSISLIRTNILTSMSQVETASDDELWVSDITNTISSIAERYPLPKTMFLITHTNKVDSVRKKLDEIRFTSLWLSENPPKIIPVLKSHLISSIQHKEIGGLTLPTLFMIIYYKHYRLFNKGNIGVLL